MIGLDRIHPHLHSLKSFRPKCWNITCHRCLPLQARLISPCLFQLSSEVVVGKASFLLNFSTMSNFRWEYKGPSIGSREVPNESHFRTEEFRNSLRQFQGKGRFYQPNQSVSKKIEVVHKEWDRID